MADAPVQPPQSSQSKPGLPSDAQLIVFDGFDTLNTKPSRPGIGDQEMFVCQGWMPLGRNNLRTLYGIGSAIYSTTLRTIDFFGFGNLADTPYCYVFLDNGSVIQVNTTTHATTTVAPASTIVAPTAAIDLSQWGNQYIIFVAPQDNGYFVWDGTLLYRSGTLGPAVTIDNGGLDYTGSPTMVAVGGHGSGAAFTATVDGGNITQITVTNAGSGYQNTDAVVIAFSSGGSPGITAIATASLSGGTVSGVSITNSGSGYTATTSVQFLGGGGTGANATVSTSGGHITTVTVGSAGQGYTASPTVFFQDPLNPVAVAQVALMPFGVKGNAVETFQSRVWVADGSKVLFTAPSAVSDFSPANGGGNFRSTDSFLRVQYTALRQTNGFLYLIGDSSVNYISGVTTQGSPPLTTFSNQNVDPQIGTPYAGTVQVYSRAIVFGNTFGVQAMYGGAIQKVSDPLDGIYTSVPATDYGDFKPSAAVAIIFGIHVYMQLLPILDQVTGQRTNTLLMWDGKRWWTAVQEALLSYIANQEINSFMTAWGTDGKQIVPLFQTPSTALTKTVQSKLWDKPSYIYTKKANRVYGLIEIKTPQEVDIALTIDTEFSSDTINNNAINQLLWYNNGAPLTWTEPDVWLNTGIYRFRSPAQAAGSLMGMTLSTAAADLTLLSLTLLQQVYRVDT